MPTQPPIRQSELDGRILAFNIAKNYVDPKQLDEYLKDVTFYTTAPIVEEKTPRQIDAEALRSLSATTAIVAKNVDKIADTLQKATDLAEALNGKTISFQ